MSRAALFVPIVLCCAFSARGQDAPKPFAFSRTIQAGAQRFTADFARIDVPEDPEKRAGARVQIAVCRLRSTAAAPAAPLFYIPGAPESAARLRDESLWSDFWAAYLQQGDVVLIDQRGLGESRPKLTFDDPEWKPWLLYTDEKTATDHMLSTAAAAREMFAARNIKVSAYDARACVEDIEAVRKAIGYDRIRLMGHSGGSHLALAYVRKYAPVVERLVSIGTAGPNDVMKPPSESDAAFRAIAKMVRDDASIGKSCPDLDATARRALDRLSTSPIAVNVTDPRTKAKVQVPFGRFGLQLLLVQDLGDERDFVDWPRLLKSIEEGKSDLVQPILQKRVNGLAELPLALFVSRAASGASKERWAQIDREAPGSLFGRARMLFCPAIGDALGVRDAGDAFRATLRCDVSALFVSGSLDAHTPPQQADRVRAGFSNSAHIILQHAGHDTILFDGRLRDRMLEFLSGGKVQDQTIPGEPIRFSPL